MTSTKVRVLCILDYFLPGSRAGGPIRTLANMCEILSSEVEFSIFTRDHDLGADERYSGIHSNEWVPFGGGYVYYADRQLFSPKGLARAKLRRKFDVIYLNSFFSVKGSILVYLQQRLTGARENILVAPRGEFSPGALSFKRFKKRSFLVMVRIFGLYRDVYWHASSKLEAEDILRQFPHARGRIQVAADPVSINANRTQLPAFPTKKAGELTVAFISRISPKKNLDGLINILGGVERRIDLSIFGPIEDAAYWRKCLALIDELPANIKVVHHGAVSPDDVLATFAAHDVFAFPTHGENFGHVIFEALRAGTPVLLSDQTPWKESSCGAVSVTPLDALDEWRRKLEQACDRSQEEQDSLRSATLEYARRYIADDQNRLDNLAMFRAVRRIDGQSSASGTPLRS